MVGMWFVYTQHTQLMVYKIVIHDFLLLPFCFLVAWVEVMYPETANFFALDELSILCRTPLSTDSVNKTIYKNNKGN